MSERKGRMMTAAVVLAWLVVYGQVLRVWAEDLWHDPNYGHGVPLAVFLLVLGVMRMRRPSDSDSAPTSNRWIVWGTLAFMIGVGGILAANDSLRRWSAILAALAILEALAPWRTVRSWRAPLLAMLLLVAGVWVSLPF